MTDRLEPRGRRAPWRVWLPALLSLPLSAAVTVAAPPAATATPILLGACLAVTPNPTTIIQVAMVIGVIAIFWLSRSVK